MTESGSSARERGGAGDRRAGPGATYAGSNTATPTTTTLKIVVRLAIQHGRYVFCSHIHRRDTDARRSWVTPCTACATSAVRRNLHSAWRSTIVGHVCQCESHITTIYNLCSLLEPTRQRTRSSCDDLFSSRFCFCFALAAVCSRSSRRAKGLRRGQCLNTLYLLL